MVCGGKPATKDCYTYNPEELTWSEAGPMNVARSFFAATKVSDDWIIEGKQSCQIDKKP